MKCILLVICILVLCSEAFCYVYPHVRCYSISGLNSTIRNTVFMYLVHLSVYTFMQTNVYCV
jgi:hypothetical protein